jgi:transcriptional regulator with XRE-family HTH domain
VKALSTEAIMKKARAAFERSGLSLDEVGRKMGAEDKTARQSVWQFLNKTADPRLSMLIRFAEAVGIEVKDLL